MLTFLLCILIYSVISTALQCLPVHSFWQPKVKHYCINQVPYYIVQGALNFVTDVVVVLMPIPILWSLQLPTLRKLGLVVVFLLGGL